MDTCVPSPKLNSIYDLDKPSLFCQDPKLNYRFDVCSTVTDESGPLDDCTEDSYVFTPEFLSSMASSSSTSTPAVMAMPNFWNAKGGPEEPLAQEQNILLPDFVSDFLNFDSDDSKFSIPDFDRMTSNPPSSCQTPVPTLELRSDFTDPSLMDRSGFGSRKNVMYSTSQTDNIGQDFVQKKFTTMKSNFPPRKSEPPVGVVAPVKVEEDSVKIFEHSPVKMEVSEKMLDMAEASPQTVPSYTDLNQRSGCRLIKMEPVSPDFASGKRESLKRPATEDNWDSANHLDINYGTSFPVTKTKRRRNDSGSSGITSEDGDCDDNDYSQIDYDSDDDNSDLDADLANLKPGAYESLIDVGKKQKQYFWQYNVQAKGPKGTRLKLAVEAPTDPHVLNGFEDPVFDEGNTTVAGIRHGGKARKGDGNEVTPNPYKLFKIGHQLLRLNKKINACQLGSDVPVAQRNESRKEKNKLASRACRLKKKAQHEANKIKLNGLEMEHGQINNVLRLLWPELRERAKRLQSEQHVDVKPEENLLNKLNGYITSNLKNMVAGHTTNYVNDVIMTVEKGDTSGGLNVRARKS